MAGGRWSTSAPVHSAHDPRGERRGGAEPTVRLPLPESEVASARVVTEARAGPGVRTAPRGGQPAPRGPVCHTGPLPSWKGRRFIPDQTCLGWVCPWFFLLLHEGRRLARD